MSRSKYKHQYVNVGQSRALLARWPAAEAEFHREHGDNFRCVHCDNENHLAGTRFPYPWFEGYDAVECHVSRVKIRWWEKVIMLVNCLKKTDNAQEKR